MKFSVHSLLVGLLFSASLVRGENPGDWKSWTIEGDVQSDAAKPGPDGKPSLRVGPRGKATLKLRDADGSGKVTLFVYDDGVVASPDKKKSVGPRWGTTEAGCGFLSGPSCMPNTSNPKVLYV